MISGVQAEVRRITREGRDCILKSPRNGLFKPFSRWSLAREFQVYHKLEGTAGVPACFGLMEDGLLLEAIDGRPLSEFRRGEVTAAFLDSLDQLIDAIHRRGVVHSDLKKRANILVVTDREYQRAVIVDFGAAFLAGELFYETFRLIDLAAAAKLRAHHQPVTLRADQQILLDHPTWAERLSRLLIRTVRDPWRSITHRA